MNWPAVIDRNRAILLRILAALFAKAGLDEGAVSGPDAQGFTLPRHRLNAIRRILRTVESAIRRLVVIAARDLADLKLPVGPYLTGLNLDGTAGRRGVAAGQAQGEGGQAPVPAFALTDPPRRFCFAPPRRRPKAFPRITCLGLSEPTPIPEFWYPTPDDELDAGPLCRRLVSLKRALDDLDGQARRLARWQARRDRASAPAGGHVRPSPMRTGRPPGFRKRETHEVDAVLSDLQWLALYAISPDTS